MQLSQLILMLVTEPICVPSFLWICFPVGTSIFFLSVFSTDEHYEMSYNTIQWIQKLPKHTDIRLAGGTPLKAFALFNGICQIETLLECNLWRFSPCFLTPWRWKFWLQYSWVPNWVINFSFDQQSSWQVTPSSDHGCSMWHTLLEIITYI